MELTMQSTSVRFGATPAQATAEATRPELSPSFETFLATIRCWLDHARPREVIALAALVNAECARRGREVHATDRHGCGQGAVSAASATARAPIG
jgi:hypothetical protein